MTEHPGRRSPATLARTAESIDVASRTLLAEFEVPNPKGELLPGAYAEVHIDHADARVGPVAAGERRSCSAARACAWASVADGVVKLVRVTLGRDFGTEAEVASGLTGERVGDPESARLAGRRADACGPSAGRSPTAARPAGAAR